MTNHQINKAQVIVMAPCKVMMRLRPGICNRQECCASRCSDRRLQAGDFIVIAVGKSKFTGAESKTKTKACSDALGFCVRSLSDTDTAASINARHDM
jgi:hypothetical protein